MPELPKLRPLLTPIMYLLCAVALFMGLLGLFVMIGVLV